MCQSDEKNRKLDVQSHDGMYLYWPLVIIFKKHILMSQLLK